MWKWLGRLVFGKLHTAVDNLTPADLQKIADYVNKKVGGNKEMEAKSIKVIIELVQAILDVVAI
jgi:hypothetical protein